MALTVISELQVASRRLPAPALATCAIAEGRGTKTLAASEIATLVGCAQRGQASAFECLAVSFLRPAYAVALAIVRRPADAEDVAQDSLLMAFTRIETCREPERFVAWLMTIVRNQAKNWLERRRLRDVSVKDEPFEQVAPEQDLDGGLERARLLRAFEVLSVTEREVVLLHDLEGLTHQEISDALSVSCVMSRQHLFVARKKLRAVLDAGAGDPGIDAPIGAGNREGGDDE